MKLLVPDSEGLSLLGHRHGLGEFIGTVLLAACFAFLSYLAQLFLGPIGLVALAGGMLAVVLAGALALRSPVLVFVLWLVFLSGFHTVGMIRMPGLPDVSIVRLLQIQVMVIMLLGWLFGKNPFKAPILPDMLLLLHTFYILFNAMFIADGSRFNLWTVSSLMPMLAYFFAKQFFEEQKHIAMVIFSFVGITVYFWVVSIAEQFRIMFLIWPKSIIYDMNYRWIGRSRGPFLQPAVFGQILGMYLLVHFFLVTRHIRASRKLLLWANLGIGAVGLLFTYTRGGWLAAIVGLGVMAVLRPSYRKIVLVLVVLGVLGSTLGIMRAQQDGLLAERIGNTGTIENRAGVLYATMKAIQDKPIFGVGYFMFKQKADKYSQGVYVPGIGYVKKKMGDHGSIHDMYMGRMAEEGLIGMLLWFGFMSVVARIYIKRWKENPQGEWFNRDLLALFGALTISYLVGGLAINYRFFGLINILPYFFAGVVVGFPSDRPAERDARYLSEEGSI